MAASNSSALMPASLKILFGVPGGSSLWAGTFLLRELLDAGDVFAHEADEDGLRGRLAVNPVFDIVAFGITLADLAVGLPDRGNKFLAVHAYHGPAVLNGLFHFRRQCIEPLHGSGTLFRKIQERRKELLQFIRSDIRQGLVEFQENSAAQARLHPRRARILRRGGLHRRITAAPQADLEMIAPVLLAAPAAV